jgi:hypothetical protein
MANNAFVDSIAFPVGVVLMRLAPRRGHRPASRFVGWGMRRFARAPFGGVVKLEASGDSTDIVGRLSDLTREYLRNMTHLPSTAVKEFKNFKVAATTLRHVITATKNDWSAILWHDGKFYESRQYPGLEILDRVGGGDSFASGLAYAFLAGKTPAEAVQYGAAHGALAMTTPGDTSMASLKEVEAAMKGKGGKWTIPDLNTYLMSPRAFVPGTSNMRSMRSRPAVNGPLTSRPTIRTPIPRARTSRICLSVFCTPTSGCRNMNTAGPTF